MPKASNAEIQVRLDKVVEMLLDGHTKTTIVRHGAEKWGVATRQMEEYMAWAWEFIHEAGKEETPKQKARVLKNFWRLFQEAKEQGDRREQHALINSMSKILGLEIAPAEQPNRLQEATEDLIKELEQDVIH
jgi:hypothetical protein